MKQFKIFPMLLYLQFLYFIGAFMARSWVDDQILWVYGKLDSWGHKVHYNHLDK